jgi:hypothetical protein
MSGRKKSVDPRALSRLYLHAVLPCLADMAAQDKETQKAVADWDLAFGFRVVGGPGATLRFAKGKVEHLPHRDVPAAIELLFVNDGHLNAFFSGKNWALPIVIRGIWRVGKLIGFSALADRMQKILLGDPAFLADAAARRLYTRLTLITAGLGLRPLAQFDPVAGELLRSAPLGLAEFVIGGEENASVWFENGSYAAGWGVPPRHPEVILRFADTEIAYLALRDEIDTLVYVGDGRIEVDGLVPLADTLNAVMERLRLYLEP